MSRFLLCRNNTMVEAHCYTDHAASSTQQCCMDVSILDGLTSSVKVDFLATNYTGITLDPPKDWQCPERNRLSAINETTIPTTFLPEWQACVSNCLLLNTPAVCCPPPCTAADCSNANPALVVAGPEAYTNAYDDDNVRCTQNGCLRPLRSHTFRRSSRIMHITTCYTS